MTIQDIRLRSGACSARHVWERLRERTVAGEAFRYETNGDAPCFGSDDQRIRKIRAPRAIWGDEILVTRRIGYIGTADRNDCYCWLVPNFVSSTISPPV